MSIQHLCDHRVVLYQAIRERDELQDVDELWEALAAPAGLNARPNQNWSGAMQQPGPGDVQRALRQWFLVPEFEAVAERMVMVVVEGQEAGAKLKIESVTRTTAPKTLHHYEVNVSVWTDPLPCGTEDA